MSLSDEKRRGQGGSARKLTPQDIARMTGKKAVQPQVKVKAEHTVKEGDTLGAIALKYYGSAVKDKWMKIYEANKDVIGENPNIIRPGQVLKIPEL